MKKLMLMGAFLLSVGAFAQSGVKTTDTKSFFAEVEKQGYVQVDANSAYNPIRECWAGLIFECDENGNPIRDFESYTGIIVYAYGQDGVKDKQREYCETGTIVNPIECKAGN
ncbi:MAG: hypothetical protein LBI72_05040 [Flavobacteriaceae bacterium]|jgi:hypothetical protein|nr:hypothetical protein [Flavobacteriaceae bacterium]